ncbi:SH3 domain-containing protein [Siminovitchia sediminis]|uniref:SH3 domain-containing protein n=1 Tax=Siminovitchia sediminis TaxID=1274353 RepID=A0ABW4KGY9_9BACI
MKKKLFLMLVALGLVIGPFNQAVAAQSQKVMIDPGHGGSDSGAVGNGLLEKNLTLDISRIVNQYLVSRYDVETRMTRNSDVYLSLKQRTDAANSWGADLFLSIHINAAGGTGYEDYTHNRNAAEEDIKVQQEINKEVNKVLLEYQKRNRGMKQANFHVLRESEMASVLLEILFIDHASDAELLKNRQFLNDISAAIATGVGNALSLPPKGSGSADASSSNSISVTSASGTYIVTASSLNVRSGNGTNYPSIGTLKKDNQVKVTGITSNNWYRISFGEKTGYVSGAYLKAEPAPKPAKKTNTAIKVSSASGTYIVTASSLNVRSGNGTNYPSIGTLKKDNQVKVTGITSNNWYRISFGEKTGYVSGAYLKAEPAPKPAKKTNTDIKVSSASGTYIVTASSLNVRSGNSTKYSSLGTLKKNNQVKVTGKTNNNWYRISFKGKTGYVSGSYLKAKPAPKPAKKTNTAIKVSKASGTYIVTASTLNVRAGNGTNFKSIGNLKKNNRIHVTGKTSNGWYRFTYQGKTGYVHGKYIKAQKPFSAAQPKSKGIQVSKVNGTYKVTASSLNVRSGNATSYAKIGNLKRGSKVKVTEKTSNGWYRISYKSKTGYVSGKYVKPV